MRIASSQLRISLPYVLLLCSWLTTPAALGADFFVAKNGRDTWSGKLAAPNAAQTDGPFATLAKARDAVRAQLAAGAKEAHSVQIRAGLYELPEPLALTAQDSGTKESPVVWRNFDGERVILSGGRGLTGFGPVTEQAALNRIQEAYRPNVQEVDLKKLGITDFGKVAIAGEQLELFLAGKPMTLARWPNEGFVRIGQVTGGQPITVHGIQGVKEGKFITEEDRLTRWTDEPELWLSGYWFWDWSDARQKVKSLNAAQKSVELVEPYHHYGYRAGQRYYVLNALSELDAPGEWYLDRQLGKLYFFWPPVPSEQDKQANAESSTTSESRLPTVTILPTLFSFTDASWITLKGLMLENTRAAAVTITGGAGVRVGGCIIRNTGAWGVTVNEGTNHGVLGCEISETGEGGIWLSGGDRKTLTPAGHFAENNHIHHFARLVRTYQGAVELKGVGQRVSHNHIHDAPHLAIQLAGNDHLIEFNDIHHVCNETGDVGAFYMGRDWTERGNIVRHNYFHQITGPGLHGAMAVYLDDAASGTTVFGNVFFQAGRAAFIGGGRNNVVENNIFVECNPAVHIDNRGENWMHETVAEGGTMRTALAEMPYQTAPWSTRYPELVKILEENPAAPLGNKVLRNISVRSVWHSRAEAEGNLVGQDPGFVDEAKGNFQLRPDSAAWALGFKKLPLEQIGLVSDAWRAALPPAK